MKKYKIYQVDSFTKEIFKGNPAGVVSNADGLTESQMLQIARELNNSETAFIFSSDSEDFDVQVRFFTPLAEVPICGHATVAAHFIRAIENNLGCCTVLQKTGAGILPVEIINDDDNYKIIMTQGNVEFREVFSEQIRNRIIGALNISETDLDQRCPVQVVSTGHSKVMIGIKSLNTLNFLNPDFYTLAQISNEINCNGFFVFTLDSTEPNVLTNGRMFAPVIGINEDPVTGNANGPLGAYLIKHKIVKNINNKFTFIAKQGEAINRAGYIEVEVMTENEEPVLVKVGGYAKLVFQSEIIL